MLTHHEVISFRTELIRYLNWSFANREGFGKLCSSIAIRFRRINSKRAFAQICQLNVPLISYALSCKMKNVNEKHRKLMLWCCRLSVLGHHAKQCKDQTISTLTAGHHIPLSTKPVFFREYVSKVVLSFVTSLTLWCVCWSYFSKKILTSMIRWVIMVQNRCNNFMVILGQSSN